LALSVPLAFISHFFSGFPLAARFQPERPGPGHPATNLDMEIIPLSPRDFKAWDEYVRQHPHSTIYHTSAWLSLLQEAFGYTAHSLLMVDRGKIIGGLPLWGVKGFGEKRLVSSPFRDRGGVLTESGRDPSPLINGAITLCTQKRYSHLLLKQDEALDSTIASRDQLDETKYWVTTRIDLSPGPDSLWKGLKNNAIGPVKQARKSGVTVRAATRLEDMSSFYRVFLANRKKLGIPCFAPGFFSGMWLKLCEENLARLFLAEKGGRTLAGILLLLHRETVIDGYAASLPDFYELRPNDLLVWEAIQWAAQAGYHVFDFGADSPKQKGLLAFKKKWGGVHYPMHHYFYFRNRRSHGSMRILDSSEMKYSRIRNVLSRLPTPLFQLISRMVVSRFG
jgi:serine/alanine adding enzyme